MFRSVDVKCCVGRSVIYTNTKHNGMESNKIKFRACVGSVGKYSTTPVTFSDDISHRVTKQTWTLLWQVH